MMGGPIPKLNPAEFGSYESYLSERVGGIRATRGMSRADAIGRFAKNDEDEDGKEEPVVIGKTGHFVNLSTGSLRELQTGLWGRLCLEEDVRGSRLHREQDERRHTRAEVQAAARRCQGHCREAPCSQRDPRGRGGRHGSGRRLGGRGPSRRRGAGHPCRTGGRNQALCVLRQQAHDGRDRPSWRRGQQGGRREEVYEFSTRRQQRRRGRTSRGRTRGRERRQRPAPPRRAVRCRCSSPRPALA